MPCSPEQLASNRRNATRSTGPVTPEGKAKVRGNAVKHGLTGEGLALPVEDAAEVERRFRALGDDLRPVGERERILAHRAAFLSVRLDRCAAYETAALSEAIRTAEADHDRAIRRDIDDAVKRLPEDPISSVARLERTAEGIDWMLRSWGELAEDVTFGSYLLFNQVTRAENLLGRRSDEPCNSRVNALATALGGNFQLLDPPGTPLCTDPARVRERKEAARTDLIAIIRAEIDRLTSLRAALPFDDLARSRAEAPLRRLFDPSTSGVLFRRYETAAARELHRTFAHFDDRPAEPEPEPPVAEAIPTTETTCGELALSRNFEETGPEGPSSAPEGDGPSGSTASEGIDGGSAEAPGSKGVLNLLVMDAGVVIEGATMRVPRVAANPRAASIDQGTNCGRPSAIRSGLPIRGSGPSPRNPSCASFDFPIVKGRMTPRPVRRPLTQLARGPHNR